MDHIKLVILDAKEVRCENPQKHIADDDISFHDLVGNIDPLNKNMSVSRGEGYGGRGKSDVKE